MVVVSHLFIEKFQGAGMTHTSHTCPLLRTIHFQTALFSAENIVRNALQHCNKKDLSNREISLFTNAADRNRTGTMSPPQDFKSCASASSATPAYGTYRARTYDPLLVRQMLSQLS